MGGPSQLKYLVPNGLTALSMVLGLAAILTAAAGDFTLAAWMVVWGVLLDTLDGAAARLLNATSAFGAQLDSFSDFVVFGLAPAALVYFRLAPLSVAHGAGHLGLLASLGVYVIATAARLARFNVEGASQGRFFVGIPSTTCGGLLALLYLTWERAGLGEDLLTALPIFLVAATVAMSSRVRLPKLRRQSHPLLNLILGLSVLAAYTLGPLRLLPEVLLAMTLTNIAAGLLWAAARPAEPPDMESGRRPDAVGGRRV